VKKSFVCPVVGCRCLNNWESLLGVGVAAHTCDIKFVVFSFYPSILYPGLKDNPFSKLSPLAQRGKFWTSHPSFYVRVR